MTYKTIGRAYRLRTDNLKYVVGRQKGVINNGTNNER
jgi:hypothetical protein